MQNKRKSALLNLKLQENKRFTIKSNKIKNIKPDLKRKLRKSICQAFYAEVLSSKWNFARYRTEQILQSNLKNRKALFPK